ncbi:MAG TPA: hypothetical protein VGG05_13765 [Pseudonocardiaceae bacterium]
MLVSDLEGLKMTDSEHRLDNAAIAAAAPKMFAVVEEYGDDAGRRIAAWGMAFANRATVVGVHGGCHLSMHSPEAALRAFNTNSHLIWINQ